MVYSFYFLLVGSRRNECNSLWEELRGRGQKSTATQKVCLPAFLLALTLYLQWSILFIFCVLAPEGMNSIVLSGENGEKSGVYCLLSSLCWSFFQVSLMIRWYCKLSLYMMYYYYVVAIYYFSWRMSCVIWCTSRSKIIRASSSLLLSPPSGAKTQKKEILSYPRCGFGACLRCGWAS